MKSPTYKKILDHPDKDEIIAKLAIGIPASDINDWLKNKYININDAKFVLSEKIIKSFKNTYLDFYNDMHADLALVKNNLNSSQELEISVKDNPAYKDALVKMANGELDIRTMIATLAINVETRIAQIFDLIQEDPRNANTKIERLLTEYVDKLGSLLEKYYKFTEAPADHVIQHNFTIQTVDQHISVFYDVIKETLAQMDVDTSLYFMEVFNEKMNKIKFNNKDQISTEVKLAEVKVLNETINKKLNES